MSQKAYTKKQRDIKTEVEDQISELKNDGSRNQKHKKSGLESESKSLTLQDQNLR